MPATEFTCTSHLLFLPAATKLGQGNVFTGIFDSVKGGVSASVHAGMPTPHDQTPPPGHDTPQDQTPPKADTPPEQTPPGAEPPPPRSRQPLGADTPRDQTAPPGSRHPPGSPREADSGIRSTSGRHASYWNAFVFCNSCHISASLHMIFVGSHKLPMWHAFQRRIQDFPEGAPHRKGNANLLFDHKLQKTACKRGKLDPGRGTSKV